MKVTQGARNRDFEGNVCVKGFIDVGERISISQVTQHYQRFRCVSLILPHAFLAQAQKKHVAKLRAGLLVSGFFVQ